MSKIVFEHGGKEFDDNYPDGIPTEVVITDKDGKVGTCTQPCSCLNTARLKGRHIAIVV